MINIWETDDDIFYDMSWFDDIYSFYKSAEMGYYGA